MSGKTQGKHREFHFQCGHPVVSCEREMLFCVIIPNDIFRDESLKSLLLIVYFSECKTRLENFENQSGFLHVCGVLLSVSYNFLIF